MADEGKEEFVVKWVAPNDVAGWGALPESEKKFNSNNHRNLDEELGEAATTPEEYEEILLKTSYTKWCHWIENEHRKVVKFSPAQISLLKDATTVGVLTSRISSQHEEDLQDLVCDFLEPYLTHPPYFIRLDESSPKDSLHGIGPFSDARSMIQSIVTSMRCCKAFQRKAGGHTLVLLPWREIFAENQGYEFRTFVCHGKMTAISQYMWHTDCAWKDKQDQIPTVVQNILNFLEELRPKFTADLETDSFVMDVFLHPETLEVELVELNSFGAQQASGSALFHWLTDYHLLNGKTEQPLEIRFVGEE